MSNLSVKFEIVSGPDTYGSIEEAIDSLAETHGWVVGSIEISGDLPD